MARNKSEQLPSCPQAIAYAVMVDQFLEHGTHHLELPTLWWDIPIAVRRRLENAVPTSGHDGEDMTVGDRRWRGEMARRIRAWYAP